MKIGYPFFPRELVNAESPNSWILVDNCPKLLHYLRPLPQTFPVDDLSCPLTLVHLPIR